MFSSVASFTVIALFFLSANWAFVSPWPFNRLGQTMTSGKIFLLRLIAWALSGFAVFFLANTIEANTNLQNYPQGWEFYGSLLIVYLCFTFPGAIYRYLWLPADKPMEKDTAVEV